MPGPEATYPEGDLFPVDEVEYEKLKAWCLQAFNASARARQPREDKWLRSYKLYNNYVGARKQGDWRSRVFMPESFQTVETQLPRMAAQLPKWVAQPRGPEDVENAKTMTELLDWARENSEVHLQLVDSWRDALIYGTGILKTYFEEIPAFGREQVPIFEEMPHEMRRPILDGQGNPQLDLDGQPMFDVEKMTIQVPAGYKTVRKQVIAYDGPVAKSIDPFHFWVAPESESLDDARYVIHRSYPELADVKKKVMQGLYHWPADLTEDELFRPTDDPYSERLDSIDLGPGNDPTRKQVELLEFWTKDQRVITLMNRKAVIRVQQNPFDHGQKPFVVIHDYKKPHEFWGKGEVEVIEGLQDLINAITNQRVDNVRIGMDQGFGVNTHQLKDPRQLAKRPGQVIEVTGDGMNPSDVIFPLPVTEVTQSSFREVDQAKDWSERTTGNSAYQQGLDTPSMNDTASGVSMILEQGQSRMGLKAKVAELGPYRRLGLHFGSILQQFTTQPKQMRITGDDGMVAFSPIEPGALMGAFDFTIESASVMQTETMKREQAMNMLQTLAPIFATGQPIPPGMRVLIEDVYEAFGKKNVEELFQGLPDPMQMGLQQLMQGPPEQSPEQAPQPA